MAYNDCVAATLAAAIVAGSCAGVSVQKRGANVGRATGSRQCDGARVEEMTLANQEVALRVRSLVRSPREGFARIEIVATNLTGRLLWLNAKPSALVTGLPQEQQLFVTAEVPRKHLGRSRTYDVVTASSDSYAVLGPHEDRVIAAMIDTLNLELHPGDFYIDVCFWDRTLSIPPPPVDARLFRGPILLRTLVTLEP